MADTGWRRNKYGGWFNINEVKDKPTTNEYMNNKIRNGNKKISNNKETFENVENEADSKSLNEDYSSSTDRIRDMAKNYYNEIGYNGTPKLVSESEYDELKANGYREIARGIRGYGVEGKNGNDFLTQYKEGETYIGNQRVFGSGTYYSYENNVNDTISRYSNKDGITYTALLSKDARIISNNRLNELKSAYSKQMLEKANAIGKTDMAKASKYYDKMNRIVNLDNGIFAASLGYDAIDVEDAKYIVSLNRNKIIIKK